MRPLAKKGKSLVFLYDTIEQLSPLVAALILSAVQDYVSLILFSFLEPLLIQQRVAAQISCFLRVVAMFDILWTVFKTGGISK